MLKKPTQITDFIKQWPRPLQHLAQKHHQQLIQLIKHILPDNLSAHCHMAVMQDTQLCLFVDTPLWANQLRFASPQLLQTLRKKMPHLAGIKIRTRPVNTEKITQNNRKIKPRHFPEASIQHIHQYANFVEDTNLKTALRRLSKTMQAKHRL